MKILVVGDSYMPAEVFEHALATAGRKHQLTRLQLDENGRLEPETPSERGLREYVGHPRQILPALVGQDAVVFHAAPISDAMLDAAPGLKLVGCARGGPVNVDVAAATARRIPVLFTPGKNAEAVADLTIALMLMLARGIIRAQRFILDGGRVGESVVEGAQFFGRDLGALALGLVGFGAVGSRVAKRALAFGMRVRVFDPFVPASALQAAGVEPQGLDELLAQSDVVSVHARGNKDNANLFGRAVFASMKPGALFVNTARDTLVDEDALCDALRSRRLGGAALDVVKARPVGEANPLLGLPNVIVLPHIAGSTHETVARGAEMLAADIDRFVAGEPPLYVFNRDALRTSTDAGQA